MSVAFIVSTDAQLDFSFGRTTWKKTSVIGECDALSVFADNYCNCGNLGCQGD